MKMGNIIIRPEREEEFEIIYKLIKKAFETADVKDGTEQEYANKLRAGIGYLPKLALVAEKEGKLIGHIMLTKTSVQQNNGEKVETLLVAPLSVLVEYRNQGIGSLLIKEGLERAKQLGFGSAFLLGDPKYYQRFGFRASKAFGIYPPAFIGEEHWENTMAIELKEGALKDAEGTILFEL